MDPVIETVDNFARWRDRARAHLLRRTPPAQVVWEPGEGGQRFLFESAARAEPAPHGAIRLPRDFVESARILARHCDPNRWSLLYRIAWRLLNENPHLLHVEVDDDVRALALMRKAVEHDIYKMRAFVRFRKVAHDGSEQYIAWYRPEHRTLDANERFFVDRFGGMRWAILTPEATMAWDLESVHHGPGVPRSEAPGEDEFEELWRTYYTSVYNPARLNLDAMRAQLPVFRWEDLPESRTIPELVRASRGRVLSMAATQAAAATRLIPPGADLAVLRESIRRCDACELCSRATQAVFGEGPGDSRILIAGEQPGDEEDRAGRPFVGPAGKVLDSAMHEAGINRESVYVANSVKAFRFEERGKRRIHQSPRPGHIAACRPWLEAEVAAIRPQVIVCMGATAAQSVLGRTVRIGEERRMNPQRRWDAVVFVTYHPSAILRAVDEHAKTELMKALVEDLTAARLKSHVPPRTPTPTPTGS